MNKLVKTVNQDQLTREFLLALNGILQLTSKQIDIMCILIDLYPTLKPINNDQESIISARIRKLIMSKTGTTADNLSRHLKQFRDKGLVVPTKYEGIYTLNKAIVPELINDRVQITLILKI